jgi:hypothetical protein
MYRKFSSLPSAIPASSFFASDGGGGLLLVETERASKRASNPASAYYIIKDSDNNRKSTAVSRSEAALNPKYRRQRRGETLNLNPDFTTLFKNQIKF